MTKTTKAATKTVTKNATKTDKTTTLPSEAAPTDTLPFLPTPRVLAAAAKIKATFEAARRFAEMGEAVVHKQLWIIREGIPDEGAFDAFVRGELGMDPAAARRRIAVWDHARQSRPLRELARSDDIGAVDALKRIERLVDEVGMADVLSDDTEVRKLLSLPGKQLTRTLRRMLDETKSAQAGAKEPTAEPAPAAAITTLTPVPALDPRALIEPVLDAERALAALSPAPLAGLAERDRRRLLRAFDGVVAAADNIIDAISAD